MMPGIETRLVCVILPTALQEEFLSGLLCFIFVMETYPVVLRAHSWCYTQELLLVGIGELYVVLGSSA